MATVEAVIFKDLWSKLCTFGTSGVLTKSQWLNALQSLGFDESEEEIEFVRLEAVTGAKQLGSVEVTPLSAMPDGSKIVTDGAYYLQSHLQKSESGGGHHH